MPSTQPVSLYRLSPAIAARVLGGVLVLAGSLVVLVLIAIAIFDLSSTVLTIAVVALAAVVILVGLFVGRRPVMVRLDDAGYQLSLLPKAGVQRARWSDVEDVVTGFASVGGDSHAVIVIRLAAGKASTIPVNLIAGSADDFARDIQARLKR